MLAWYGIVVFNVPLTVQVHGLFLSGSPPIPYIYIHMYIFLMANCCCCLLTYLQQLSYSAQDKTKWNLITETRT